MTNKKVAEIRFGANIPILSLFFARNTARYLNNTSVVALLGYNNICMLINKDTNLIDAKKEFEDKLKFFVEIACKRQEYR